MGTVGLLKNYWVIMLEMRKTGSKRAMAIVPMIAPIMVIIRGSMSVVTFLMEV